MILDLLHRSNSSRSRVFHAVLSPGLNTPLQCSRTFTQKTECGLKTVSRTKSIQTTCACQRGTSVAVERHLQVIDVLRGLQSPMSLELLHFNFNSRSFSTTKSTRVRTRDAASLRDSQGLRPGRMKIILFCFNPLLGVETALKMRLDNSELTSSASPSALFIYDPNATSGTALTSRRMSGWWKCRIPAAAPVHHRGGSCH